jgi:hypothetical protein
VLEVSVRAVGNVPLVHEVHGLDSPPDIETTHGFDHGLRILDRCRVAAEAWLLVAKSVDCGHEQETGNRQ